ncbi:MAG: phosphoribosylformylglycinamidine synthase, partial [Candidatus Delongbacteria bacterium]|nr:phosphoribosylformylglycinamidine synthase [Candidatus Delongbacteria bacterium]MCG2760653.1 AIR synthase-related protein [Candidatus Delongbacteria bacterium]
VPIVNDPKEKHITNQINEFLSVKINNLKIVKNFYIQGISEKEAEEIANEILSCPITENYLVNGEYYTNYPKKVEIAFQHGVMNPEAETISDELKDKGYKFSAVMLSYTYCFKDYLSQTELSLIRDRSLMNSQIQMELLEKPQSLLVNLELQKTALIPIGNMSDKELIELSDYKLFLNLNEMRTIQNYFKNLDRDAYDVELETLAQTWSEHCGHKTFKAKVILDGVEKRSIIGLVKDTEKQIAHPDVISKFEDNSGVFRFTEVEGVEYGICIKAETHNSPSGLDPYGGAMTGTGGVLRDIAGTGKGAKNISSINIFCLGDPDMKMDDVHPGCLHPRRILTGVIEGVRDYGNRMGIPTNNGSFHFHKDFGQKPTVLVGADGIIPLKYAKKGQCKKGDLFISFGGKTGKDGIHGATFSSAEMTEKTSSFNSGAVQIGNPIEEKRMFDCLLELRDMDVFTALTDCGAGGYSSAVGEMGEKTGAIVHLDNIPLKYPGLSSFEKWISESQERMVATVPKEHLSKIETVCKKYNVNYFVLGEATDTKRLTIYDGGELVCDLDMDFLHNGQPLEVITAVTKPKTGLKDAEYYEEEINYTEAFKDIISHLNVCSKEPVIRQYDHGVQGTCVEGPLCGKNNDGPTGGCILKPLHNSDAALVFGHGLNPVLNRIDPYKGTLWAYYEALSNVIALGGDPKRMFLIENHIWPKPTETNLADLYQTATALSDACKFFGTPIISGKDSLSSTYKSKDVTIEIPPVVCISARSVVDDWKKTISPDLKKAGSPILLIGDYFSAHLGGSIFFDRLGQLGTKVPEIKMETAEEIYNMIHNNITNGNIISASDVSEGGALTALAEMAIGGKKGFDIFVNDKVKTLFAEVPAAFVAEMKDIDSADELIETGLAVQIGTVTSAYRAVVNDFKGKIVDIDMYEIENCWKKPLTKYFK